MLYCFVESLWRTEDAGSFIRVGTLDQRGKIEPDVHIFTASKVNWVDLSAAQWEGKVFEGYYDRTQVWTKESQERLNKILSK